MVDAFSMLVSHGMLLYVVWRLLKLRDPDEQRAGPAVPLRNRGRR